MQQKNQKQNSFLENSIDFVLKNKLLIGISSGAVLVIICLIVLFSYIVTSNKEKANRIYDIAISYMNNMNYITNNSERAKIFQDQVNNLATLVQIYPDTIAATRARLFLGKVFYEEALQSGKQDSINMALTYYTGAYENTKVNFYKVLALMGRAQCYEQKNEFNKAFDDYNLVVNKYSKDGFTPTALVGMARSKEMMGNENNEKEALEYYQRIVKDYPSSEWAKYAKGKIYFYSEPSKGSHSTTAQTSNLPFILPSN